MSLGRHAASSREVAVLPVTSLEDDEIAGTFPAKGQCSRDFGAPTRARLARRDAGFGWFAYAPLSNTTITGIGIAMISQGTQIGLLLAVVGLLVLAFWGGLAIGRRR